MSDTVTTEEAMCKLADKLEALADSIDRQDERQKTAAAEKTADYGTLGSRNFKDSDVLTAFLLGN